jgi:hypothetical protein
LLFSEFFLLAIELVKLLCLPNGSGLGGNRLGGIIMKPLLNIFGQLGKIKFGNTALRFNHNSVRLYLRDRRVFVFFAAVRFEVVRERD